MKLTFFILTGLSVLVNSATALPTESVSELFLNMMKQVDVAHRGGKTLRGKFPMNAPVGSIYRNMFELESMGIHPSLQSMAITNNAALKHTRNHNLKLVYMFQNSNFVKYDPIQLTDYSKAFVKATTGEWRGHRLLKLAKIRGRVIGVSLRKNTVSDKLPTLSLFYGVLLSPNRAKLLEQQAAAINELKYGREAISREWGNRQLNADIENQLSNEVSESFRKIVPSYPLRPRNVNLQAYAYHDGSRLLLVNVPFLSQKITRREMSEMLGELDQM
jgi:hypothetical protein